MEIGDVMIGRGVGRVVASRNPSFGIGEVWQAKLGWREFAVIDDDPYYMPFRMRHTDLPLSHGISTLAMSGFTALIGMREICAATAGDRVLVSGAAGGVGSQAGFVARALGADHVIGIAGGPEKCRLLTDRLGYSRRHRLQERRRPGASRRALPRRHRCLFRQRRRRAPRPGHGQNPASSADRHLRPDLRVPSAGGAVPPASQSPPHRSPGRQDGRASSSTTIFQLLRGATRHSSPSGSGTVGSDPSRTSSMESSRCRPR